MEKLKCIIIGSGPAGYTAGIYTARADMNPLIFAGKEPGGQLMTTTEVENWPGVVDGIQGPELMEKMKKQAERFGAKIIPDIVTEVDFGSYPFIIKTEDKEYQAQTVIIATGATARWLGIPGEEELKGKGVSACATCDGFFFKEKHVVIVGGGDAALEEATFLTKFASKVTILVRKDAFKASKPMQERALSNKKIVVLWNTEAQELIGTDRLEKIKVINNKTKEVSEIEAQGFFVSIGHKPNTEIFKDFIDVDDVKGYINHEPDSTKTNIPAIFACGDVMDFKYRQAITAAGSGCKAALEAEKFLADKEVE